MADQNPEDMTLAALNVSNTTALRLTQATIDRIRSIARRKSETSERDIPWPVVGRDLLERALLEEERPFDVLREDATDEEASR